MSLSTQSSKVRTELLPGYPDIFKIMFDSVKIEGPPVEVEEASVMMARMMMNSAVMRSFPLSTVSPAIAVPSSLPQIQLRLWFTIFNFCKCLSEYDLSDEDTIHIRSCFLGFYYLQIEYSNSD